jgi:superfamily II DNA helicase RecQ
MRRAPERTTERKFRQRMRANLTAQVDDSLLGRLKSWRAEEAKRQGVPAYVILHDATLIAIAQVTPTSLDALANISGIGAKRLERYGDAVLTIAAQRREEGKGKGEG